MTSAIEWRHFYVLLESPSLLCMPVARDVVYSAEFSLFTSRSVQPHPVILTSIHPQACPCVWMIDVPCTTPYALSGRETAHELGVEAEVRDWRRGTSG